MDGMGFLFFIGKKFCLRRKRMQPKLKADGRYKKLMKEMAEKKMPMKMKKKECK